MAAVLATTLAMVVLTAAQGAIKPEPTAPVAEIQFPALDMQKINAEDRKRANEGLPFRFAIPIDFHRPIARGSEGIASNFGTWEDLGDGTIRWRLQIHAEGASSLNFGFSKFFMPPGGELYVYDTVKSMVRGPYTDRDNEVHGELWTPVVFGDTAIIEVIVPVEFLSSLELELTQVSHGYREFWKSSADKSGGCNIDVVCPAGNGWRDQIRAVAAYSRGGSRLCTGQMINNTAGDLTPYFLTANHCGMNSSNAASMVVYWNYENSVCRTPGAGAAGPGDGSLSDSQTGAIFRASRGASDFTLLELDDDPNPAFDVFWTGWDRSTSPKTGTAIHHPDGEEKRISFDFDSPTTTSYLGEPVPGDGTHWRITAWDEGTTEPGSSGSGLWNDEMRLIGQLHGGFAACDPFTSPDDNDESDWYGQFAVSWDAGAGAADRLSNWLDPVGGNPISLNGTSGCDAPSVDFESSAPLGTAGTAINFTSSVSGGQPPYSYAWDVDGNGTTDSTDQNVTATYPSAFSGNVSLFVTDAADCGASATDAQIVKGASISLNHVGDPVQLAGNGDAFIDPGERWSVPITLHNDGGATAEEPHAVFSKVGSIASGKASGGPDSFGYTWTDSSENTCDFDFVNISDTGTAITFNPSSAFPPNDDGASSQIPMQGTFDYYGAKLDSLILSSNGYLATDADSGGDWENECPLPQTPTIPGDSQILSDGRLAAYHDDLITGSAHWQYFASCPRDPDLGAAAGCQIFQWSDVSYFDNPLASFDFQALLYDTTNEIVFQYPAGNPDLGASGTSAIQNQTASDGLTYTCNTFGSIADDSAVCFTHPDALGSLFNANGVNLETPLLEYPDMPFGGEATMNLVFSLDSDYPCGDSFAFDLEGVISETGFSDGQQRVFSGEAGNNGQCAAVNKSAQDKGGLAPIAPDLGMMYNPKRDGHGIDVHTSGPTMFLVWYTYLANGTSVWYIASGDYVDNQFKADLLQFTWPGEATGKMGNKGGPTNQTVGSVTLTFSDPNHAAFIWTLNGETSGEPFQTLIVDTGATPMNRTGHWFPPSQSGWGMTVNMQGDTEFEVLYIYDIFGFARWVIGPKFDPDVDTTPLDSFLGFCPTCARVGTIATPAGSVTREFKSATTADVTSSVSLPAPLSGDWMRSDVPFVIISDPQ